MLRRRWIAGRNHRPSAETLQNFADLPQGKSADEALAGRRQEREPGGKFLPTGEDKPQGKSADLAAESVGWSGETYRKAKAVVDSGPSLKSSALLPTQSLRF